MAFPERFTETVEIRIDFKHTKVSRYVEAGLTKEEIQNIKGISISLGNDLLLYVNNHYFTKQ